MDTLINSDLGGYQLIELIRRGGMATVYKAYQSSLNRFVAVKVLDHHHDRQFVERFKAEARIVGQLQHPDILQVYEYGEHDGLLFLVSPYVEQGASLADVGKPLPLDRARILIERLLAALEYAHARGIVHRDVKPSNILLPATDWPLLADFGIAKLLDAAGPHMTATGQVVGTAAYMAPEQAAGEPIDARTDVYAAGVVFYELVTGQPPFGAGPRSQVLARHLSEPPPPPRSINPDVPAAIEPILQRALAKRPTERYENARAMAADLERLADRERHPPRSATQVATEVAVTSSAMVTRRPTWMPAILALALLVVLLGGAAGLIVSRGGRAPPQIVPTAPSSGGGVLPSSGNGNGTHAVSGVVWRDKARWNDQIRVTIKGLPPPPSGQVYAAWLVGHEQELALGPLQSDGDSTMAVTYVSPNADKLLAAYDRVYVTSVSEAAATTEPANVIMIGRLPGEALVHIHHLLMSCEGTPDQIGFATLLSRSRLRVV
jgi:tRNA A-37 threonylcarbamoyl transferase component Bud32